MENKRQLSAQEIATLVLELYRDGRITWCTDKENISKENAIKLAEAYLETISPSTNV